MNKGCWDTSCTTPPRAFFFCLDKQWIFTVKVNNPIIWHYSVGLRDTFVVISRTNAENIVAAYVCDRFNDSLTRVTCDDQSHRSAVRGLINRPQQRSEPHVSESSVSFVWPTSSDSLRPAAAAMAAVPNCLFNPTRSAGLLIRAAGESHQKNKPVQSFTLSHQSPQTWLTTDHGPLRVKSTDYNRQLIIHPNPYSAESRWTEL